MDRETTQRLLKESIIFLCRTYIGVVTDFEVDGIICISRDDGISEQHVVFKIHELVSKQEEFESTCAEGGFGPELKFDENLSLQPTGLCKRPGSKKRKLNSQLSVHQNLADLSKKDNLVSYANSVPVFPVPKLESPWHDELKSPSYSEVAKRDRFTNAQMKMEDNNDEKSLGYSCYSCDFYCIAKKILDKHMLSVHEQPSFCFCNICNVGFTGRDDFDVHNQLTHPVCVNRPCLKDGSEFTEDKDGGKTSQDDNMKHVIGSAAIFPISSKNSQVFRNCRPADSVRNACDLSVLASSDVSDGLPSVSAQEKSDAEDGIIDQSAPRECALCSSQFLNFPAFNIHCKEAHEIFACPYCVKTFAQQLERDNHLFKHTGEKPFECPDCSLSFSRVDSLWRHRMKAHSLSWDVVTAPDSESVELRHGIDGSGDPDAEPTFPVDQSSVEDVFGIGANSSQVGWFDVGLDAPERLFDSVQSHPGSCQSSDAIEISDEESSGRSARNRYRNIKTLDPDRTFVCEVCRETIHGVVAFRDHCDSTHRRVPCPYCGGTFTQKASMERHQRQHTGERPFQCQFCSHTYTRKENLHTHMLRLHPLLM